LVRRIDGLHNRWFLDPIFTGVYPEDALTDLDPVLHRDWQRPGDLAMISVSLDVLGINFYTRHNVMAAPYPGTNLVEFSGRQLPRAANGWEVDPDEICKVLLRVSETYTKLPIYH
jgi:beta-glucosidase